MRIGKGNIMEGNDIYVGTWSEIPTSYATNIIAKAGMDVQIIDMEHGVIGFELAQNMIFAAHSEGKNIFIRVPSIEEAWILRALDTGCDGIVFPQVTDAETVHRILNYTYFMPEGSRGFNPYIAAGGYTGENKRFFLEENERIKLVIILEGKEAFENIEEILQFQEIDIVYIGQYDLSMALGIPGEVENPLVLQTMAKAVEKIRKSGKMAGCMVQGIDNAWEYVKQGFNFIVYKVDSGVLFQSMKEFVDGVKKHDSF